MYNSSRTLILFPLVCISAFLIVFVYAAYVYLGGHYYDHNYEGFHLIQNYRCDLYKDVAYNGELSPSQLWALTATGIIGIGCSVFFYLFPRYYPVSQLWDRVITISGIGAMISVQLLFTSFHSNVIGVASILGGIAILGMIKGLLNSGNINYVKIGGAALFLLIFNNLGFYLRLWTTY